MSSGHESPAPLAGLVLAGGRSARMGEDKAGLVYTDMPQALCTYRLLEELCDAVFVSDRHEQSDAPGHYEMPHIFDMYGDIGPINGILSAFDAFPDYAWLVVACDLPCLTAATLRTLVDAREPAKEATVFRNPYDLKPEPLCGIYEPSIATRLLHAYRQGRHSPRALLLEAEICTLALDCEAALQDANDPAGRTRALTVLEQSAKPT